MRRSLLAAAFAIACAVASGQSSFDVASVRRSPPIPPGGRAPGQGPNDPGLLTLTRYTLKSLINRAYGITRGFQLSAPSWMDNEFYDVSAKIPEGSTAEQVNTMLQNLLATRFQLTLHHESKDFPGFVLTVAKGGSKLKESKAAAASGSGEPQQIQFNQDREGFSMLAPGSAPGIVGQIRYGHGRFYGRMEPMAKIADMLEHAGLGGKVVDQTGLTGKYDFQLDYSVPTANSQDAPADNPAVASDPGLTIQAAAQQQLGLKIEEKKIPYDVIVVDHAERDPLPN